MRQLLNILPIDDQETCGIVWDHEVASVRGVFFNYEEAPRSLFFLNRLSSSMEYPDII
jgi:hypothetical protein